MPIYRIIFYISIVFFVGMLIMPTTFQLERATILLFIFLSAIISAIRGKFRLDKELMLIFFLTITVSLFYMFRGQVGGGPGSVAVGTVYVVWPVLYILFIGTLNKFSLIHAFLKGIIFSTIICSVMGIWLVAEFLGVSALGGINFLETQGGGVGISDGFIEYSLFNMTTLIYAFPFLVAILFIPKPVSWVTGRWRIFAWCAFVLTVVTMVISGRRMFWLVALLTPWIVGGLFMVGGMPIRLLVMRSLTVFCVLVSIFFLAAAIFGIKLERVEEAFVSGFNFSSKGEEAAGVRGDQFADLVEGWTKDPLLGVGHGVPAPHVIRSVEQSWTYELSYIALLYQTGLLGVLIYGLAIGWTFLRGIEITRRDPQAAGLLLPLLAGMTGFLISNATNPYLAKFDYLWTIFLPVAAINAYLVSRQSSTLSSLIGTPAISSASVCGR